MSLIDQALSANATIANGYDPGRGGPPAPKIAIVTCADPRLSSIEQMLGLAEGDVDMIRNFGTVIDDDAVRSLVLSTGPGSVLSGCGRTPSRRNRAAQPRPRRHHSTTRFVLARCSASRCRSAEDRGMESGPAGNAARSQG
jgi:hypothetical protein